MSDAPTDRPLPPGCFRLDGIDVPCRPGETLIEAADRAGIDVPHLCWSRELGASGSCRLCIVEIDGRQVAACTTRAEAGRRVASRTPALDAERRVLLAMLFAEGRHFCPGCEKSGDCALQSRAYQMDLQASNWEPFAPERPVDASHPDVMLDATRCILCGLCVRASERVDGKSVFAFAGHGVGTRLVVDAPDGRLGSSRLSIGDRAPHVCPVGALLPKRQGFAVSIGERAEDRAPLPHPARPEDRDGR